MSWKEIREMCRGKKRVLCWTSKSARADRLPHEGASPRLLARPARAGDGIRTHDNDVGNVVLYQLSYTRGLELLVGRPRRADRLATPRAGIKDYRRTGPADKVI